MSHRRLVADAIEADIRKKLATGSKAVAYGHYWEIVNGVFMGVHAGQIVIPNAIPTQSLNHMLDVVFGATAKAAGWYLALGASGAAPASGWTAANVATNAGEITSATEGYSNATRPQYTPAAASGGVKSNVGSEATFTMVSESESEIEVTTAFLISDNARGGATGVLGSAAAYPLSRKLQDGDAYKLGYQLTLVSAA